MRQYCQTTKAQKVVTNKTCGPRVGFGQYPLQTKCPNHNRLQTSLSQTLDISIHLQKSITAPLRKPRKGEIISGLLKVAKLNLFYVRTGNPHAFLCKSMDNLSRLLKQLDSCGAVTATCVLQPDGQ